jgi:hypothetical protein
MHGARRVGDTVRRPLHPNTEFVHALLDLLQLRGFGGAPRFLGVEDGEEILSYVDGFVPVEEAMVPRWVWQDAATASAFRLIRSYHDATADSALAGGEEVVCHGDLSPWNTVYRDQVSTAFLDWDQARPAPRLGDIGYGLWRFLRLGLPGGPALEEAALRALVAVDAYGLDDRSQVVEAVRAEQRRQRAWFQEGQKLGDPAILRLVGLGALGYIERSVRWIEVNGRELQVRLI